MRYRTELTIPVSLRREAPQPLYVQIARQVRAAVDEGRLAAGTRLPSSRTLAARLGVSRGVVAAAYDRLFAAGYLAGRAGSGSYVPPGRGPGPGTGRAPRRPVAPEPEPAGSPGGAVDLRPGQTCREVFPAAAWRAAWWRAAWAPPPSTSPPPEGLARLRRAIAAHLRDTRGLAPAGHEVVVTGGVAQALRLVLDVLGVAGPDVAMVVPAPAAVQHAVPGPDRGLGGPTLLPADRNGVEVAAIPPRCRALVVSADAQQPYGYVMSDQRRREVADWATRTRGGLVDIACDEVFRPVAAPLPRLPDLAGGSTVTVGGFDSLLGPGLRLGYALVPAAMARPLARLLDDRGVQPAYPLQLAVAELLEDGTVVRLMHRLGRAYRRKWRLLEATLGPLVRRDGGHPISSAVLRPPGGGDAAALVSGLRRDGFLVGTLAGYHAASESPPPGLVVGYGHLPDPDLRAACERLAAALADRPAPVPAGRGR
jgi:GntR family transcriptional regulator / MocR family aminotransferase